MMPVATPRMPSINMPHHRAPEAPPRTAATRASTPSTRALAPKKRISTQSVSPGHTKTSSPNRIASTPRRASADQLRVIMGTSPHLYGAYDRRERPDSPRNRDGSARAGQAGLG